MALFGIYFNRMNVCSLLKRAAPALFFGFLLAFSSNVGQTFFIALFSGEIRNDLELSHGRFGAIYSAATLGSAIVFLWLGKSTDKYDLPLLGAIALLGLSGCMIIIANTYSVFVLCLALFGMRLLGQALPGHIAITAMARWFSVERGRAISIATLGYPVGEALLPILVATCLTFLTWREIWTHGSLIILIILLPAMLWSSHLLRSRNLDRHQQLLPEKANEGLKCWTRAQVLRDQRFYILLPGLLAPPFIITGVLFHQVHLVEMKSWLLSDFASCYPLYAISATIVTLVAGWMVDRFGAVYLLQFYLLPLAFGLALIGCIDEFYVAPVFMALIGASAGGATVLFGALWAEMYGTDNLGSIRSLSVTLQVFSTAVAPALLGALIDVGIRLETQFLVLSLYVFICAAVFGWMRRILSIRQSPPRHA